MGCQLTLADIMLYYALHPVMTELSVQEREQLVNLSRWFNQVNLTITGTYLIIILTVTDSRILIVPTSNKKKMIQRIRQFRKLEVKLVFD